MNKFELFFEQLHMHNIFWIVVLVIASWKISQVLDAILSAISEKNPDGTRGQVSIKRIIPFIFAILICYMVIGCMHSGKEFNTTAFFGLLFYIALATTVITYAQATGLLDKINMFKSKAVVNAGQEDTSNIKKDNSSDNSQTERRNEV